MVSKALAAAKALAAEGVSAAVIDMFTIKPLDEELLVKYAKKTGAVVVAENHSVNGGLTDAVCRVLAESCPVPARHVAIDNLYGQVGPQDFLEKAYDLTPEHIAREAKAAVACK